MLSCPCPIAVGFGVKYRDGCIAEVKALGIAISMILAALVWLRCNWVTPKAWMQLLPARLVGEEAEDRYEGN